MLELAVVVVVCRADERPAEPGQRECRATLAGGDDHARAHVERLARERHAGAAARADARHLLLAVDLLGAQPVGPHPGCVDHVRGAQLEHVAAHAVAHEHSRGAPVPLDQPGRLTAVREHRPEALGLPEHGEDQAHVVRLAVVEEVEELGSRPSSAGTSSSVSAPSMVRCRFGLHSSSSRPRRRDIASYMLRPTPQLAIEPLAAEAGHEHRQRLDQVRRQPTSSERSSSASRTRAEVEVRGKEARRARASRSGSMPAAKSPFSTRATL